MAVTVATFRGAFPAFTNATTYPDPQVQMYIDLANQLQDLNRWGTLFDTGVMLFTAHHLVLDYQSNKAGALGQKPGEIEGPVNSGSVDKVSYGRDPSAAMNPKDGHWNLSTYGIRYAKFIKMLGAGPQIATVPLGGDTPGYYPAPWPGPYVGPF